MSKIKKRYIIILVIVMSLLVILYFNANKKTLELSGYGFTHENNVETNNIQTYKVKVILDTNLNDDNINNDKIEIDYEDISIIENILIAKSDGDISVGDIIHYDNEDGNDEILGTIVLLNKDKKCFISLYNDNLDIIAPVDDEEMAKKVYLQSFEKYFNKN